MRRPTNQETKVVTVMFIDVVNYTKITTQLTNAEFHQFHDAFDAVVSKVCKQYSGKIIKKIGDAFLVTFNYSMNAFDCAKELQNSFEHFNVQYSLRAPLKVRVVLHTGEVMFRGDDVYGTAVNLASRLEKFAGAGQIVFSESTRMTVNSADIPPFTYVTTKRVKGIPHPVRVYRVKPKKGKLKRKKKKRSAKSRMRSALVGLIQIMVIIALAVFFYYLITGG